MANPLEAVAGAAKAIPMPVYLIGGAGIIGFVVYRKISSGTASAATQQAAPQAVPYLSSSQSTGSSAAIGELAAQETQALSAMAAQQTQQQTAFQQSLLQQQALDAQNTQAEQSLILGGLSQQQNAYAQLQGQTENYLTQNQQSFSQAASTFGTAQSGMANSLAMLWQKIGQASAPAAPVATGPTAAQIAQNAQGLDIPVFDIQSFAGEYHHLPGSIPELDNFLNSVGLRNATTGALLMPH